MTDRSPGKKIICRKS